MFGFLILFLGGIILTAGDLVIKVWVEKNTALYYFLGIGLYLIGLNFLAWSFKFKDDIAVASLMLVIFNILTLSLVNYFFYKDGLNVVQIGGMALGILALVLLELG